MCGRYVSRNCNTAARIVVYRRRERLGWSSGTIAIVQSANLTINRPPRLTQSLGSAGASWQTRSYHRAFLAFLHLREEMTNIRKLRQSTGRSHVRIDMQSPLLLSPHSGMRLRNIPGWVKPCSYMVSVRISSFPDLPLDSSFLAEVQGSARGESTVPARNPQWSNFSSERRQ
jgi:hypothetical protein